MCGIQQDAHESDVSALCFSPDGTCLATGGSDKVVKVWTLRPDMRTFNSSSSYVTTCTVRNIYDYPLRKCYVTLMVLCLGCVPSPSPLPPSPPPLPLFTVCRGQKRWEGIAAQTSYPHHEGKLKAWRPAGGGGDRGLGRRGGLGRREAWEGRAEGVLRMTCQNGVEPPYGGFEH